MFETTGIKITWKPIQRPKGGKQTKVLFQLAYIKELSWTLRCLDFLPQRGLIRLFTFSFRNEPRAEGLYFKTVLAVSKRKVKRKSMGKEKAFSFSKFADITKKLPLSFLFLYGFKDLHW